MNLWGKYQIIPGAMFKIVHVGLVQQQGLVCDRGLHECHE